MKKVVIFGAGLIGQRLGISLQKETDVEILFFVDNNSELWNSTVQINNVEYFVYPPASIIDIECDKVYVAIKNAVNEVREQCIAELKVEKDKIDDTFVERFVNDISQRYLKCRDWFLESYAYIAEKNNIEGMVAEVGVFRGGIC